jgi:hypothetical protein
MNRGDTATAVSPHFFVMVSLTNMVSMKSEKEAVS